MTVRRTVNRETAARAPRPAVTVLTLHASSRAAATLDRCLASVGKQDADADVRHVVVVDSRSYEGLDPSRMKAAVELAERSGADVVLAGASGSTVPRRVARLRREALEAANGFVAWLDDDNWWDRDHLASLLAKARDGALCYSFRRLCRPDGSPYRSTRNPWQPAGVRERNHRDLLHSEGIREGRSPLLRDALFRRPIDGYAGTIDLGEWLFPPGAAQALGMPVPPASSTFSEDDILLHDIVASGTELVPTGRFTLNYCVGGDVSSSLGGGL